MTVVSGQWSVAREKAALREEAKSRRAECDPGLGSRMAWHVLRKCAPPTGAIIGGFWPLPDEIDVRTLIFALEKTHEIALPETPAAGAALVFRKWRPGDALAAGRFNTQHATGPALTPDFLIIPLLAYDLAGNRLGYGGGYYDRTLAMLPNAYRLGCAYAAQQLPKIPTEPHDLPLHAIATERGVTIFS